MNVLDSFRLDGRLALPLIEQDVAEHVVHRAALDGALGRASILTPSRGGVGPLTITMLLHNTLMAHRRRTGA